VIVENELDCRGRRIGVVELFRETVSVLDAGMDHAGQKVGAGQKAQGPVSDVFVFARHALVAQGNGRQVRRGRSAILARLMQRFSGSAVVGGVFG